MKTWNLKRFRTFNLERNTVRLTPLRFIEERLNLDLAGRLINPPILRLRWRTTEGLK